MKNGSQIFELFGYPVDTWSPAAQANLATCNCPFMDAECDGGGNRFSSGVRLSASHPLKRHFKGKSDVQAGVCALQLHRGEQPWIVCPRRLLNYRKGGGADLQAAIKDTLRQKAELPTGRRYAVWSEVKMKCEVFQGGKQSLFDYTFDYVITGRRRKRMSEIADLLGEREESVARTLAESGFTTSCVDGARCCDDFPSAPLLIVEVMTSSTSGGNKRKRTQISQLFEDTILKLNGQDVEPSGPGINYRQVWARMVSQLLVKSQIGKAWGGTTFWVLQDLLVDYISKTTALNLADFAADEKNEVNIISGGYGENVLPERRTGEFALVNDIKLYPGPVSASPAHAKSFSDIIKLGVAPDVSELWKKLIKKRPCATFGLDG